MRLVDEPAGIDKTSGLLPLADNTHPIVPLKVLMDTWKAPIPDFIVSVIGSSHSIPVTPEQFKVFKPGFIKAVSSSNAWIIGGGSLHGIDKLVTECIKG